MDKKIEKFEFRVIDNNTGEEADIEEIAFTEDWAEGLIYCDMEGFAILEDGNLVLFDEFGNFAYCPNGRFSIIPEGAVVLTKEEWAKRNAEIEIIKIDNDTYLKETKRVCELELKARRELEKFKRDFDYNLVQERKQIRKETAEKFAEKARAKARPTYVNIDDNPRKDSFIFLSDIDEICKEITEGKG